MKLIYYLEYTMNNINCTHIFNIYVFTTCHIFDYRYTWKQYFMQTLNLKKNAKR